MAYNLALGIVRNATIVDLVGSNLEAEESLTFDSIGSSTPGLWVAQVGEQVVVIDPELYQLQVLLEDWSQNGDRAAYLLTFAGVGDMYVIQAFGSKPRLSVRVSGEQVENEGDPLPEEAVTSDDEDEYPDEEDRHLKLAEGLLEQPWSNLFSVDFTRLRSSDGAL